MKKENIEDTIVALATPPGIGAISVIRISGSNSFKAIDSIFAGKVKISGAESHTVHYGRILDNKESIDDVLVTVFKKPNSYTGEDSAEISSHGSPFIVKKIIELLLNKEIRPAEPGEFTKRAFLNNKIDLAQAEAVADIINSRTRNSARGARNQFDGKLSSNINEIKQKMVNISSFLEIELDFAEEEIEFVKRNELEKQVQNVINEINNLLDSYSYGKIIRDGVNVSIVGEPNVGKSSLLNSILKESRAIVSHIPGTTRDIIREDVSLNGFLFKLHDTAGIRFSEDEIEKEGIERSRNSVRNADLILFIGDAESEFAESLVSEMKILNKDAKTIRVFNKIDLIDGKGVKADVYISAKTGENIDQLIKILVNEISSTNSYTEKDAVIVNLRHYDCLKTAAENLKKAKESISKSMSGEFISSDIRAAVFALAELIGEVTPEDILNNIFSKFCIGK